MLPLGLTTNNNCSKKKNNDSFLKYPVEPITGIRTKSDGFVHFATGSGPSEILNKHKTIPNAR